MKNLDIREMLSQNQRVWLYEHGVLVRFTAHMLSLSRIPLGFVVWNFVTPDNSRLWIALLVFTIAALTDWLDGQVARLSGQTTKLGAILDPICDKIFVISSLIAVWYRVWLEAATLLIIIEAFYFLIAIGSAKNATEKDLKSNDEGKLKLGYECLALGFYILDLRIVGNTLLVFAIVFAVLSGIQKIVETRPSSRV